MYLVDEEDDDWFTIMLPGKDIPERKPILKEKPLKKYRRRNDRTRGSTKY